MTTENTFRKSDSDLFLRIFENSLNEIYVFDEKTLFFRHVNQAALKNLGYTSSEIALLTPVDIKPLVSSSEFEALIIPLRNGEQKKINFETVHQRKDGSRYTVDVHLQLMHADRDAFFVAIILDVTHRKEMEESLRENQQKLHALFSSMTEMVAIHELVFDNTGKAINYRIIDCNDAYTAITGIAKETALNHLATDVYGSQEPPYLSEFAEVAMTGNPYHFETYYGPMEKYFSISVVSPQSNRFATVTTDITSLKQAQMLVESKNKELEQIIYVASHDLRSPLVNADGYSKELQLLTDQLCEIIEKDILTAEDKNQILLSLLPDIKESLNHIRKSSRQMDKLLNGLLRMSRIGRAALIIGVVNMNRVAQTVCQSFDYQFRQIQGQYMIGELPVCRGDEIQVTQVLMNLIENAIKYRDPDRFLEVSITGELRDGVASYTVEDNGLGIEENHLDSVFELFHRLDPKKTEGEGLGLTIVKQILHRLNGVVSVTSKPGLGTAFTFRLPGGKSN
jgi:PAS domain S-box-containing protein